MSISGLRRVPWLNLTAVAAVGVAGALLFVRNSEGYAAHHIANVSYDPTRELYQRLNPIFVAAYEKRTGSTLEVRQSHAGSSYQARRVISGEEKADVVTLGLPSDVEALHNKGLIPDGWADRLPNQSRPYFSTIVFVVRRGNPRGVHDWPDLVKPDPVKGDLQIIVPDPKTSGNGKLAALAAWGAIVTRGGDDRQARQYLKEFYARTPFLDPAARSTGVAFAVEKKGDVHVAWENEALREVAASKGELEIVYPPVSIRGEPTVAWVDSNVHKRGSEAIAKAYLEFLFTPEAQDIIAQEGYRPIDPKALERHGGRLAPIKLFPITDIASSWSDAQRLFFAENGVIDAVYAPKPRTD